MENVFYQAHVLENLYGFTCALFGISLGCLIVCIICWSVNFDSLDDALKEQPMSKELKDKADRWAKRSRRFVITCIIGMTGMIFIPDKQTYLFMLGGRAVDQAVNTQPEIQEIPSNTLNLLNEYIKQETEKIRQKQKHETD